MDRLPGLSGAGIFQHSLCVAGAAVLLYSAAHLHREGNQGLLQPLLWTGAAVQPAGGQVWPLPQKGHSTLDEEQGLPLRIPDLLFRHVFPDALEYLFGFRRRAQPATGGNAAVDIQAALALGVSWHAVSPRRGAVRLWVLQRDAHLHRAGADHHGAVQTPELVRLLPHGYDDPADL